MIYVLTFLFGMIAGAALLIGFFWLLLLSEIDDALAEQPKRDDRALAA